MNYEASAHSEELDGVHEDWDTVPEPHLGRRYWESEGQLHTTYEAEDGSAALQPYVSSCTFVHPETRAVSRDAVARQEEEAHKARQKSAELVLQAAMGPLSAPGLHIPAAKDVALSAEHGL